MRRAKEQPVSTEAKVAPPTPVPREDNVASLGTGVGEDRYEKGPSVRKTPYAQSVVVCV